MVQYKLEWTAVQQRILLNAWQDMDFSHPGDLEGNWYFRKPRLPRYHLMLTSVIITNDGGNQTRPDHNHDSKNVCTEDDDADDHLATLYKAYENAELNSTRIYVK